MHCLQQQVAVYEVATLSQISGNADNTFIFPVLHDHLKEICHSMSTDVSEGRRRRTSSCTSFEPPWPAFTLHSIQQSARYVCPA